MGTDKRERQKANRQLKLEEMARESRKRKTKRRGLQIGLGIPLAIALVFGLTWLLGGNDDNDSTATTGDTTVTTLDATGTSVDIATGSTVGPTGAEATPLPCPEADGSSEKVETFPAAPSECIDPTKTYTLEVDTSQGAYTAVLDAAKAPIAVNSFVYLARYHYFDGTTCHRVVPNFVVQCGDPTASGQGGPGYAFADELPAAGEYKLGSLAMANSGADTNGSQFFVISGDKGVQLPPNYTLFGQVTEGLDTIAAINALATGDGPPSETVTLKSVTVTES